MILTALSKLETPPYTNPILTHSVTDIIELKSLDSTGLRLHPAGSCLFIKKGRSIKAKTVFGMSLGRAGITPDDEGSFDSLKYIDIQFDGAQGMLPNLTTTNKTNPGGLL